MRRIELSGSFEAMGEAFGEATRAEIDALYTRRVANALGQALTYGGRMATEADLLGLAARCLPVCERFHPAGAAELRGIARGANRTPEEILAMQGLTDLRDTLAWGGDLESTGGCTSCIVQRDAAADGRVRLAQTWDLATDNMPFVVAVHRRPVEGPETWSVTTVGCLSLMGMNAYGVAIGTTNLRTTDAGVGVPYLSVIQRALETTSAREAADWIAHAPRAAAHSYSAVDARGAAFSIECATRTAHVVEVQEGAHVHCNHCQHEAHQAIEAPTPKESSRARQRRMEELLARRDGSIDAEYLKLCFADSANGKLAICRDDFDGISTNAAVVMTPEVPELWACHGLPSRNPWVELMVV
jgi:isopenicillin-N N-acyltransferase-like protein